MGQLSTGLEYKYKAIVGNTKVDFQIDDLVLTGTSATPGFEITKNIVHDFTIRAR